MKKDEEGEGRQEKIGAEVEALVVAAADEGLVLKAEEECLAGPFEEVDVETLTAGSEKDALVLKVEPTGKLCSSEKYHRINHLSCASSNIHC